MKKIFLIAALLLTSTVFTGCGNNTADESGTEQPLDGDMYRDDTTGVGNADDNMGDADASEDME